MMKAVRCGSKAATPYLQEKKDLFTECTCAVDIACGNGRNSEYLKKMGMHVMSLDAKDDYGSRWEASMPIPVGNGMIDCVLCNYFLMFLDDHARNVMYDEIDRVSHVGSLCMIELEVVKQSLAATRESIHSLNDEVSANMIRRGWRSIHGRQNHYVFKKIA